MVNTKRRALSTLSYFIAATVCIVFLPAFSLGSDNGVAAGPKIESRLPLQGDNGGQIQSWLAAGEFIRLSKTAKSVLATDFFKLTGGEAAIHPKTGMAYRLPDGSRKSWKQYDALSGIIDKGDKLSIKVPPPSAVYAFTTIRCSAPLGKVIEVGGGSPIKLWVNGTMLHEHYVPDGVYYTDLVRVSLRKGDNTILLKYVRTRNSGGISFRILSIPQAQAAEITRNKLSPSITAETAEKNDQLVLLTDNNWSDLSLSPTQVDVQVIGLDGQTITSQTAHSGELLRFATESWPEGPYEIRCSRMGTDGRLITAYLFWYHGNASTAAKQLISTAPKVSDKSANGMIHAMLAALIRDRLGNQVPQVLSTEEASSIAPALWEFAAGKQADNLETGLAALDGYARLAYCDPIDDSPHFCRVYLPPQYDPAETYPLVISLHGRRDDFAPYYRWNRVDDYHDQLATRYRVIVMAPDGWGNAWYRGPGEFDVMRCLALVKQQFSVDDDRVYLTGTSMGGAGVMYVGTRHPELFAAIVNHCGGYDYRYQLDDQLLASLTPKQRYRRERLSYVAQAESLRTTPVFISHGDADIVVPTGYSRDTARLLQRLGYEVQYREYPGKAHGNNVGDDELMPWLLSHRRIANPRHVTLRAADLRSASAHWLAITQRRSPYAFMRADAEVVAPNTIRLDTENVAEIRLSPAGPLIDPVQPLLVFWNKTVSLTGTMRDGSLTLRVHDYVPSPLHKWPELEGPASDLFNTPFIVVVGTASPDPAMRLMCRQAADRFVARWEKRFHWTPRCREDTEIGDAEQEQYSLLLIGGPGENRIAHMLQDRIPLAISPRSIRIDGHQFATRDAAVQCIYPNPANPERYVVIRAATSAKGMSYTDYVLTDVDYCIVDALNQNPIQKGEVFDLIPGRSTGQPLVAGYFDYNWRFQQDYCETRASTARHRRR